MSERLLVSDLQASRVPAALNVCPDDERFYQWANEAESLMLNQGRWWGSAVEAQFCVENGCLVLPRQVAEVEKLNVCGHPVPIEGPYYRFTRLLVSPGWASGSCGWPSTGCRSGGVEARCDGMRLEMRAATVASFSTVRGANKLIRSYPGSGLDVGKSIIYSGNDANGIWQEETVNLTLPFVDTVTIWGPGAPFTTVKDVTAARVLVYEYDTVTHTERALAAYEAGETRPSYRVGHIAGLRRPGCGGTCADDGDATKTTVNAMVSLQHVTLASPGDWLILQNLSAYKAAMMAVKAWEEGDAARGDFYFYGTAGPAKNNRGPLRITNQGGAIPLLQAELRKMSGDRTTVFAYVDESDRLAREMIGFR